MPGSGCRARSSYRGRGLACRDTYVTAEAAAGIASMPHQQLG